LAIVGGGNPYLTPPNMSRNAYNNLLNQAEKEAKSKNLGWHRYDRSVK
jgi:hypothetical protein